MSEEDWLQKAAYELWELAQFAKFNLKGDRDLLAERLRRMAAGLPFEDEFIALLIWLGRCRFVHKLEQPGWPRSSRHDYEVPDLLVFLSNDDGSVHPVLVEVKTTVHSMSRRNTIPARRRHGAWACVSTEALVE